MELDVNGWGNGSPQDIAKVLESVHVVFVPCFGNSMNQGELTVMHNESHPVIYKGFDIISLSAHDRFWSQYAYQFAHEYCHFQIQYDVPQQLRWFEESICELASYFFLPLISDRWKIQAPYANWISYAEEFRSYVENDKQKATPFNTDFSKPNAALDFLTKNEYDRGKNAHVAILLEPVFRENPQLWSVIHYLAEIPAGISFEDSLRFWRDLVPAAFKKDIEKIAKIFSVVF